MFERLKALFRREKKNLPQKADSEKKAEFAEHHNTFGLLLTAWNSFQDTLSAIEYTLCCERPFDMCRVRALATSAVTRSLQCILLLDKLSPGRKNILRENFNRITEKISPLLEEDELCLIGPEVISLAADSVADPESREVIRGLTDASVFRLLHLKEKLNGTYPGIIPPSFSVTAVGTQHIFRTRGLIEELSGSVQKAGGIGTRSLYKIAARMRKMVHECVLPVNVAHDFLAEVRRLQNRMGRQPAQLVLRGRVWAYGSDDENSGLVIWGPETDLYAPDDVLLDALRTTLSRRYSPQCMVYCRCRGMTDKGSAMDIMCMALPQGTVSGLALTSDPMRTSHTVVHVYAWRGTPHDIEEDVSADEYQVLRRMPHEIRLSAPANPSKPIIDEETARRVTEIALAAEAEAGGLPLSIHWMLRPDGSIAIVMAKPLVLGDRLDSTTLPSAELPAPLLNWGVTACAGIASGPVCIVKSEQDAKNFPDGAILVTDRDAYTWVSLLDRASGIISRHGFPGSRLAAVCREFGRPALFNVPHCMAKLENGMTVTLCADTATVYSGTVDELTEIARPQHDFLPQSPVYRALDSFFKEVAPLTITPDSPDFRASNCSTLHDIARYSHEKAVSCMFELGSVREHAPTRVKQLFDKTPKQFWVIDLADAFENVKPADPLVDISNIHSAPFHALWYGMNVHPWQGPPPINGKGFMSILYEATANPHLDPATQSSYFTEKNYFLVSRTYCSLYSRFGFHFVSAEARLGDHKNNNAVVFSLRGGAANVERRRLRVQFVADILWECGLEPVVYNDALRARAGGLSLEDGLAVLNAIGYLTIHTRQLDMIMTDKRQTAVRKEEMLARCRELLLHKEVSNTGEV